METVKNNKILKIRNGQTVSLKEIEVLPYLDFSSIVLDLMQKEENHCVIYFAFEINNQLQFIMAIANDADHDIAVISHIIPNGEPRYLGSLSQHIFALHIFEREIYENFGVEFTNHPWLKPVRFNNNYPFYSIESEELHEVGVGPVHAGVIEPGHFRFICNGEKVLHLEIQLGWQHRGIEKLFIDKKQMLQRNLLAENIAGDTVTGHTLAFVNLMESLAGIKVSEQLKLERALALELERVAVHLGDISALCTDVAYLLGANVFGILRTGIINFTQLWCGNRFGKSLIRVGGTHFRFTNQLKQQLLEVLSKSERKFLLISHLAYHLPSVQNRFDFVGKISREQAKLTGVVGMAARMANLNRDVRNSHPFSGFEKFPVETTILEKGDVFARFLLRRKELKRSIFWIREILGKYDFNQAPTEEPAFYEKLEPSSFSLSLTEGWRGEICHCAVTDQNGQIIHYKIKDPSMHNWKALELSLRNVEISDFPINNKSYNLSYCGHDL